ncbi:MAG: MerR family transcriptional regulator [Deltaproteobacteria bacterium]
MLRIGEFARLGGVTVRALRHYEAERLLAPARVDAQTGYRFYGYEQLAALDRILALRDLGLPLAEVRALLEARGGVQQRLRHQHERLEVELERQAARLRRLEALQRAVATDPAAPELGVRVRAIPAVFALGLRARVASQGAPITALFEEAEALAARDRADESPFLLFHSPRDVEACVPVRSSCSARGVRQIPAVPLAASIVYSGAYTQTAPLHGRMLRWLRRSGLRAAGPAREVYHRFGADQRGYRLPARRLATAAAQFVTELQVPAEEAG